jgi:predicted dehydrogenase
VSSKLKPTIYRAAIIGLGDIGTSGELLGTANGHLRTIYGRLSHAGALHDHPRVALVAGSSRDHRRRARFQKRWAVENVYADWRELLDREQIDILCVSTNTPSHAEIVIQAAQSGVMAIFAEKPMATCLSDADAMVKACEDHGVELAINHTRRWDPTYQRVRELIKNGAIGQLSHIDCQWASGRLACLGTHFFDIIAWVADATVKSVIGVLDDSNTPDPGGPEYRDPGGYGVILFDNGVKAFIDASENLRLPSSLRFTGDQGEILIANEGGRTELWTLDEAGFGDGGMAMRQFPIAPRTQYPMLAAVDEIVQVLDGTLEHGRSLGRDGIAALEIVIGFHVSSRQNSQPAKLPLADSDRTLTVRSR